MLAQEVEGVKHCTKKINYSIRLEVNQLTEQLEYKATFHLKPNIEASVWTE